MLFFLVFQLAACSSGKKTRSARGSRHHISEYDLKNLPKYDIPIEINDRVIAWLDYYQGVGRKHFERYLRRSGRYIPMMREILREERVPGDLVYISMIESGFNPHAYSRSHAVGLWQFIRSTGKLYGLNVDNWVDERRDPYKSTRAAARHFRDLYKEHGDWYLAMVGYNAGPKRIGKAVAMSGSRDFWKMARHRNALRAETRDYVPKFIAAAIISKMPEKFGFDDIEYEEPLNFETARVETQTDLKVIAECAGTDYETILNLNPHLYKGATPPIDNYEINLPNGTSKVFRDVYAKLPKEQRIQVARYKVKGGDTLSKIARRYGVSVNAIAAANNIKSHRRLRRGTLLAIPLKGGASEAVASSKVGGSSSTAKKLVYHRVRPGETAGGIAGSYGVSLSQLKSWNGLGRRSTIRAGQRLRIYEPVRLAVITDDSEDNGKGAKGLNAGTTTAIDLAALDKKALRNYDEQPPKGEENSVEAADNGKILKVHVVGKGETLGGIAGRNGVTTKQLMAWNGIKDARRVRAGSKLNIYVSTGRFPSEAATKTGETRVRAPDRDAEAAFEYRVKPGETIGGIANRHGVSTKDIMAWNNIKNPRGVRAGSKLKIKKIKGAEKPVSNETVKSAPVESASIDDSEKLPSPGEPVRLSTPSVKNSEDEGLQYHVKSGDTLWDIARRHNVTIAELQEWNNLSDPSRVRPGTKLTIRRN